MPSYSNILVIYGSSLLSIYTIDFRHMTQEEIRKDKREKGEDFDPSTQNNQYFLTTCIFSNEDHFFDHIENVFVIPNRYNRRQIAICTKDYITLFDGKMRNAIISRSENGLNGEIKSIQSNPYLPDLYIHVDQKLYIIPHLYNFNLAIALPIYYPIDHFILTPYGPVFIMNSLLLLYTPDDSLNIGMPYRNEKNIKLLGKLPYTSNTIKIHQILCSSINIISVVYSHEDQLSVICYHMLLGSEKEINLSNNKSDYVLATSHFRSPLLLIEQAQSQTKFYNPTFTFISLEGLKFIFTPACIAAIGVVSLTILFIRNNS